MKSCIEKKKTCRNIEYIYSMTLLCEEKKPRYFMDFL